MKPITIKEFQQKLDFLLESLAVSEDDLIFFNQIGMDEGSIDSLVPVNNISSPVIKFLNEEKKALNKLKKSKGVNICFVSPKTRDV